MTFNRGDTPGQLRDSLGSGLKQSGFFQKDGHIQNLRGGFLGPKPNNGMGNVPPINGGLFPNQAPPMSQNTGYGPMGQINQSAAGQPMFYGGGQSRQLILQAAQQGFPGNGIATISPNNQFNIVANLPAPHTLVGQGQKASYVAYLVDEKGKSGFPVGILRPIENGVYQTSFQSPVPLNHYNKAIISLENSGQMNNVPTGPIVLKVKEGFGGGAGAFLAPVGRSAKSVWGRITGLVKGRGKKVPAEMVPEITSVDPGGEVSGIPMGGGIPQAGEAAPDLVQSLQQMGIPIEKQP